MSTAATVDMLFGFPPIGPAPIHWAWHYLSHSEQTIQARYGVNGWIYLFLWWIASAPPFYYGLHLAITGIGTRNHRRMWAGITINRIGVLIPPAYVLIFGHGLPWFATAVVVLLPLAFSTYFGVMLRNPAWRSKNERMIDWIVSTWIRLVSVLSLVVQAVFYRLIYWYVWHRLHLVSPLDVHIAESEEEKAAVAALEKRVFLENGYPYNYDRYNGPQSILIGAWFRGRLIGALRLILGCPLPPPLLADCIVPEHKWHAYAKAGRLEELGTVAVDRAYRGRFVAPRLYREAVASGRRRGIEFWGFVMEPDRTRKLNHLLGTNFRQVGPLGFETWACAPFAGSLPGAFRRMRIVNPALYRWFMEAQTPTQTTTTTEQQARPACPA